MAGETLVFGLYWQLQNPAQFSDNSFDLGSFVSGATVQSAGNPHDQMMEPVLFLGQPPNLVDNQLHGIHLGDRNGFQGTGQCS